MLLACMVLGAASARALEVPGTGGAVTMNGWIDGLAVVDTGGGPYQAPWGRAALTLAADLGHGFEFHLATLGQVGGPYRAAHVGVWNFGDAFQNDSPSLQFDEANVSWRLADADLCVGLQRFAWGKLDGIPPTDVLNPRSYHDPILDDAEERKIGVPALSGTYYVPLPTDGALSRLEGQVVYVPIAVAPRLALARERWFPTSTSVGGRITHEQLDDAGLGVVTGGIPIGFGTESNAPPRTFEQGGLGLRIGGTWYGADWDLYYYGGPETNPDAKLTAVLYPTGPLSYRAVSRLEQTHDTIHMVGADGAFVLGPVSFRAEAAYFADRPYLRPADDVINAALANADLATIAGNIDRHGHSRVALEPLFVDLDTVEWGLGADFGWRGFRPLVQIAQIIPTESAPRLLIGNPDTRVIAQVRKPLWHDRAEVEVRTVYSIEAGGWFALPRITWVPRDDLRLRVGYLAVGGLAQSLIGQFEANDEVVFDVRWSF